ncbi:hypothetical protein [Candidatus Nitrospira bockiana]
MPQVTLTAHVFPSANDLEGAQPNGYGETMFETNLADRWMAFLFARNVVISGGGLPGSDPDLIMQIPTGKARIDGRFIEWSAQNVTFPPSSTSHVWVRILYDVGGLASSVVIEHNTTGVAPANAVKLGTVTTSGSAVTSTTDARVFTWIDGTQIIAQSITQALLAKPCVGTPELKIAPGAASTGPGGIVDVTMNGTSFFPSVTGQSSGVPASPTWDGHGGVNGDPGDFIGRLRVDASGFGAPGGAWVRWQYITASDEPTIWVAIDPGTGDIKATWAADDPTPGDIPGVQVAGCVSRKLRPIHLARLALAASALTDADRIIAERNLKPAHRLYRALQIIAGDEAPSRWLLEQCRVDPVTNQLLRKS